MFNGSKIKLAVSTGLAVAGIGIAALATVPAYAATGSTTGNVNVNHSITLTGLSASFSLSGAPATTANALGAVTMSVKDNNKTGYTVTVQAASANMVGGATGNSDTIPVSALTVRNTTTAGAYAAISSSSATTVASTTVKSTGGGDTVSNDYQMLIPWVNSDNYSVTLNYVLSSNP